MGAQPDFHAMYDDPRIAFSREGRTAGNAALSRMFGSPEASRAIADQAQQIVGHQFFNSEEAAASSGRNHHL